MREEVFYVAVTSTTSRRLVLGRNRESQGQLVVKNERVYCYEIYLRDIFAVFSPLFLPLARSLRLEREVGEYTVAVVWSSLLNRGLPFSRADLRRDIRERELRGEFLCAFYLFFPHAHTYARTPETAYPATMLRITGRLAGNINIEPSKVRSSEIRFTPFTGATQPFSGRTTIAVLRAFCASEDW